MFPHERCCLSCSLRRCRLRCWEHWRCAKSDANEGLVWARTARVRCCGWPCWCDQRRSTDFDWTARRVASVARRRWIRAPRESREAACAVHRLLLCWGGHHHRSGASACVTSPSDGPRPDGWPCVSALLGTVAFSVLRTLARLRARSTCAPHADLGPCPAANGGWRRRLRARRVQRLPTSREDHATMVLSIDERQRRTPFGRFRRRRAHTAQRTIDGRSGSGLGSPRPCLGTSRVSQ